MDTNVLHLLTPSTLVNCRKPSLSNISPLHNKFSFQIRATNSSSDGNDSITSTTTTTTTTPTEITTGIRFRRGSKKRAKTLEDDENGSMKSKNMKKKEVKKWEEMSIAEKGMELYVGEKGALFWLNKFAYASIYIMIGAWICFRFVGPALNFYQLDTPPLSPTDVLKGG